MTAKEFINKNSYFILNADTPMGNTLKEAMIEFAKYHVEQALKAASEQAESYVIGGLVSEVDRESILNAYSELNIK